MTHGYNAVIEILRSGDVVDEEGDVLPAEDFSRDAYPDVDRATLEKSMLSRAIQYYEGADELIVRANLGSKDATVRKEGGVGACNLTARAKRRQARDEFFRFHGVPTKEPVDGDSETLKQFYEVVPKWYELRQILENPNSRKALQAGLYDER